MWEASSEKVGLLPTWLRFRLQPFGTYLTRHLKVETTRTTEVLPVETPGTSEKRN